MSEKGEISLQNIADEFLFLDFRLFFFITMTCCVEIAKEVYSGSIFIGSGRVKKISKNIGRPLYAREKLNSAICFYLYYKKQVRKFLYSGVVGWLFDYIKYVPTYTMYIQT